MAVADTKQRILDCAERLFGEHGFADTSMRQITTAADVNLAAIHYHFGSKEFLIQTVFRRRLIPLNRERLTELGMLESSARDHTVDVADIIEAFAGPALRLATDSEFGGAMFMRLLGSAYANPTESIREFLHTEYAEVLTRFQAALARALPDISAEDLYWRMHFMLGAIAYTMAGRDAFELIATCEPLGRTDADAVLQRLVAFLSAGIRVPVAVRSSGVAA